MKSSDRAILVGVVALASLAAVWFLLISPKREEASQLGAEVTELRGTVEQVQQQAAAAETAKAQYGKNYHQLVVLGKAAPASDDTASLFVQLDTIANGSGTSLDSITLVAGGGSTEPQTAAGLTTADPSSSGGPAPDTSSGDASTTGATATASAPPATEATAALLPLGASIGPAGLPVMPYELTLKGGYFQLRDFIDGLQKLVGSDGSREIDGRLVTIDGFSFQGDAKEGFPALDATLNVTTYVAPADQGLMAGGTPGGPPPVTAPDSTAVPTSDTSTSSTP
ncbi:MAG: type II secretion system protein GspM [Solirubrobacterales bacterium]